MNENHELTKPSTDVSDDALAPRKMSRRDALSIVGKHAVYTAPAVLAVLSVTKAGDARAQVGSDG
ncbi:MAG: hypothetical protein DVS81_11855 [Candidatus Accumulibacter meliphilus]|jgi:hypothetical protein|uniref:Uncharacterized protein n=1 Tax=Candidatus Accumulibacter meliphilus TaxID=2211374 RepID=A0A369XQ89_9PROT|nr:MAG: hypothetical protein DVS81_11855 [Candidatus Accumulibacter meliphilus]